MNISTGKNYCSTSYEPLYLVHAYLHFFLNIYEENFYYSIRIRGCNFNCENWVCPINFELAKKESHKVQVKKNEYQEGYLWLPRIQGHRTQIDSLQNSIFSWLNGISFLLSICTWFLRFSTGNFEFDKLDWMFYHKIYLPHDPKNHWLECYSIMENC